MKIAYLAWGSLLWDYSELRLKKNWEISTLQLPLNFSRISDKGKGRLTLVIDNHSGKPNNVHIAKTKFSNLNSAINAIKIREKTKKNNIGYVNLKDNSSRTVNLTPKQLDEIISLAKEMNLDAIIWTDISPNFQEITGEKINISNALKYIESKKSKKRMYIKILKYIFLCKVYGNIKTPISNTIINKLLCNNHKV